MSPKLLDVWMYGTRVAELREARTGKIVLHYTDEAAARWTNGQPVLSASLPMVADRRHSPGPVGRWLEGLLPEGEARTSIERTMGVRRGDVFGLLAAIGRDCAGAVVIQAPDDPAPTDPGPWSIAPLTAEEVAGAISDLANRPLGVAGEVRASLAGQQPKLLLSRTADGVWGRPTRGAPSTHILKPQDERFPGFARNEAACVNAASRLGLGTLHARVERIGGRDIIVVPRYDRRIDDDGRIHRIHQEDLCQALSIPATDKYWSEHGHRLRGVARLLDAWAPDGHRALLDLLEALTLNAAVGNADAHAKNYSLLLHQDHTLTLAPLYDVCSTILYPTVGGADGERLVSRTLPLPIASATTVDDITVADLVHEGVGWGLSKKDATRAVTQLVEQLTDHVVAAQEDLAWDDDTSRRMTEAIRQRTSSLLDGEAAGRGDPTLATFEDARRRRDQRS